MKNENRKTKGKIQKSTNKFLDKIEKRKSKVENRKTKIENRKTKIEIFFRDSEPVDFFCQRVDLYNMGFRRKKKQTKKGVFLQVFYFVDVEYLGRIDCNKLIFSGNVLCIRKIISNTHRSSTN